ncbi:hypothetical protein L0B53_17030 [Vibrio sp. SS-MA-C1-2]|uniref:hypothetical protein n=1 Tax=Vibrio sp. SS-MA-C1-2 TaxID=2908646 RepID=UPI001F29BA5C|nr:hypothetical protein [Vibrio sp. SS-MA-C1-2]UJF18688.1 hypothetical protein L0B53_17030 [Vibrio sp. SS-MA-C1-2]
MMESNKENKLALCLLFLRLSIAVVFSAWAVDKILYPEHTIAVFNAFYNLAPTTSISIILGYSQLTLVALFLIGYKKGIIYLIPLLAHTTSTLASFPKYMDPFNNLLFFTAWPMLAACVTLYLMRDYDCLFTLKQSKSVIQSKVA